MKNITYDEAIKQFMEIINFEDFCALSAEVYHLAYTLRHTKNIDEKDKLNMTKIALIQLGTLADNHGKLLCEIANRHKILIEEIEKNFKTSCAI